MHRTRTMKSTTSRKLANFSSFNFARLCIERSPNLKFTYLRIYKVFNVLQLRLTFQISSCILLDDHAFFFRVNEISIRRFRFDDFVSKSFFLRTNITSFQHRVTAICPHDRSIDAVLIYSARVLFGSYLLPGVCYTYALLC